VVGGFYLSMGGVHLGIVAADPQFTKGSRTGPCCRSSGTDGRTSWAAVIAFHLLLMLFGWGLWIWCPPALAVLVPLAVRDWPHLTRRQSR
jgi:hypothetical protein